MSDSMKPGAGGRFKKLTDSIEEREGYSPERAKAAAAAIGRRKYGKRKFQSMATRGKRHKSRLRA